MVSSISYDEQTAAEPPLTLTDSSTLLHKIVKIPDGIDVEFLPDVKEANTEHSGSSSTSYSHGTTNSEHPAPDENVSSVETDLDNFDDAVDKHPTPVPSEDENVSSVETDLDDDAVDEMSKPSPVPFNYEEESNQDDVKSELSRRPRSRVFVASVHGDSKPYGENDSAALSYIGHRELMNCNGIARRRPSKSRIVPTFQFNELCNDTSSLPIHRCVKLCDEMGCADNTCNDNDYMNPPHTAESSQSRDTRREHNRGLKTNGSHMMLVHKNYVLSFDKLPFTNSLNILPFTSNDYYPQDKWIPSCCLSILNDEQYLYHDKSINETNRDCQKTLFVSGCPLPFLPSTMAFYSELESKNSTSSSANENLSCGFESDDVKFEDGCDPT